MVENQKPSRKLTPGFYSWLLDPMVKVANEHGYALAVHGSMARDFDIVAIPWVEEASDVITLINALVDLIEDAHLVGPHERPHGRMSASIHWLGEFYVDISIMPLKQKSDHC